MTPLRKAQLLLKQARVSAFDAFYAARDLDEAAHGSHDELIEALLVKALRPPAKDWDLVWDIAENAWPFLGERAGAVWTAYEQLEEDDLLRLEWYGRIAKQGRAFAKPWLEAGLARRLDPQRTSGKLSKQVYEAKINALLGKAQAPKKGKPVAPSDPKKGYRIEAYVAAVMQAARAATANVKLPEPLTRIHLASIDDDLTVHFLAFEGKGDEVVVKLPKIATKIPRNADEADPVFKAFLARHALDGDPAAPAWGSSYEAPSALLIEELLSVVEAVGR